ncbi:WbqC family protein [Salinimicrobium catena]|uniref:WbqC family protein n=1 Tax=Salinimicrobium catena TaxID=390640 RepID=UPI002FE44002
MKLAVMQPYFFPYLGYFQLINVSHTFVFYDDVNFITRGWINRNKIKVNNNSFLFTIPLENASQNKLINQIYIDKKRFQSWKRKFQETLKQNYCKTPYYKDIQPIIESVLNFETQSIGNISKRSILKILEYLEIDKNVIESSKIFNNQELKSQERIINICQRTGANIYLNMIGGRHLYKMEDFDSNNISLQFLSPNRIEYPQEGSDFIPNLSIIDVLMNNSKIQVLELLNEYQLK